MPYTMRLRRTCSMACAWTSPPGVPKGMARPSGPRASAGFGVSRGRLPGATEAGIAGSAHDWEPGEDGHRPVPGITGVLLETSLGVAENTLPWRSTTQTYDVSSWGCGADVRGPEARTAALSASPGGGISGHALPGCTRPARSAA